MSANLTRADRRLTAFAAAICILVASGFALAADWPQWRGPNRDGVSEGKGLRRSEEGEGTVALVRATPDAYLEKGRFDQPDRSDKNTWAHPVVAGARLYLRDQDILLCHDLKKAR